MSVALARVTEIRKFGIILTSLRHIHLYYSLYKIYFRTMPTRQADFEECLVEALRYASVALAIIEAIIIL